MQVVQKESVSLLYEGIVDAAHAWQDYLGPCCTVCYLMGQLWGFPRRRFELKLANAILEILT